MSVLVKLFIFIYQNLPVAYAFLLLLTPDCKLHFRFWGNVCRSLLFFCAISSGKKQECILHVICVYASAGVHVHVAFNMITLLFCLTSCLQLTFVFLVLPCLLLGYLGQAAYLMANQSGADQVFFHSIPSKCRFWISIEHWDPLMWTVYERFSTTWHL